MNNKTIRKHSIIQCKKCGDVIKSDYRHDFKSCKCQSIFIDGGFDYTRIGGNFEDIKELYLEDTNGKTYLLEKEKDKATPRSFRKLLNRIWEWKR